MITLQPTKNINDLIQHIETTTSIKISDKASAESYLKFINYDRLKPYIRIFNVDKPNIELDTIIKYYEFERKLKLISWDGIERIEVGLKTAFVTQISSSTNNELWYCKMDSFRSKKFFARTINLILDYIDNYEESLINYFLRNYSTTFNEIRWRKLKELINLLRYEGDNLFTLKLAGDTLKAIKNNEIYLISILTTESTNMNFSLENLRGFINGNVKLGKYKFMALILYCLHIPFYLIVEKISFGQIGNIYQGLSDRLQISIGNELFACIPQAKIETTLKMIIRLRNSIAHHECLFNNHRYKIKSTDSKVIINEYVQVIDILLSTILVEHNFQDQINALLQEYSVTHNINILYWGFEV